MPVGRTRCGVYAVETNPLNQDNGMAKEDIRSVLFITADQWQGACLSALGHPCVRTPHLDALAAEGVLFRNHFAQCSPCGPARTSMLTGLYLMNHRSGRNGTPLDARHDNIALRVRAAGYDPILFGYTDTSADPRGLDPGDPRLRSYENPLPGMSLGVHMTEELAPWRAYLKAKGYDIGQTPLDIYKPAGTTPGPDGGSRPHPMYPAADADGAFMADHILDYLAAHEGEAWFVHGVFLRPHPPLIAPEPYNTLYSRAETPAPTRLASAAAEAKQHPYLAHLLEQQRRPGYYSGHDVNIQTLTEDERTDLQATYYGLITEVDEQVGRLIAHLKKTGEYDHTLIIFTSDHGEMLGDHWLFNKEGYFDKAYHIPLIIRDPRAQATAGRGQVIDAFSEAVDLKPTILDWLDLDVPMHCDGVSLRPFLEGETPNKWRREVHWEFDFRDIEHQKPETELDLTSDLCTLCVIRDEDYKYVHFAGLPPLFFDLRHDPGELRNLAGEPTYQARMLDYAQKMLSWRMAHDERVLSNSFITPDGLVERRGPRH